MKRAILLCMSSLAALLLMQICSEVYRFADSEQRMKLTSEADLSRIASQLSIPPNWNNVQHYIYCRIAEVGKPKTQVESELKAIGRLSTQELDGTLKVRYYFMGQLEIKINAFEVAYDKQGLVNRVFKLDGYGSSHVKSEITNCASMVVTATST